MSTTAFTALPAIAGVDPRERSQTLKDLLTCCRARVRPQDVGLSARRSRRASRPNGADVEREDDDAKRPGLSQEQTAFLLGISVKSYRALENGTITHPSVANLMRLIEIFRMDPAERTLLLHTAYRLPDFCDHHQHQDHQSGTSGLPDAAARLTA